MHIAVFGAGAIGGYLGIRLLADGASVTLIGRESLVAMARQRDLVATDYRGRRVAVAAAAHVTSDPAALAAADLVLVTVKGGDTSAAARDIAEHCREDVVVVSLQNGVGHRERLAEHLGHRQVLAGMVPFNVLRENGCVFHQATSGHLALQRSEHPTAGALAARLAAAGLPVVRPRDMVALQWGKLLMNLNNAVNALAGIPLREELENRGYRRVLAACMSEGLQALRSARQAVASPLVVPLAIVPTVLRAPSVVFRAAARPMLRVDARARSSMWDDLQRGRRTEIDFLNGEIVRLGQRLGLATPINERIVELVHRAEAAGESPMLSAHALAMTVMASPGAT